MEGTRAKHTPGPWKYADWPGSIVGANGVEVADPWCQPTIDAADEMEANIKLIAAAPEMYEALQAVLADLESGFIAQHSVRADQSRDKLEARIRQALEKAGGEL